MPLEFSSTPSICLCFSLFQGSFAAIEKISRAFYFQNDRVWFVYNLTKRNHDFGVGWKLCHSFLAIDNDIYSRWYIATIGNCADKK